MEIKLSARLGPNSIFITSAVLSAAMVTLLKYYFSFNNVSGNKEMSVINKMELVSEFTPLRTSIFSVSLN